MTFGLIVGNRGFFPDQLVEEGRQRILSVLEQLGFEVVAPSTADTKFGAVETRAEAVKCAEIFRANKERIDGVIVTLPNFGDEKAVAETLRLAGLNVPVLIHAFPDEPERMDISHRRDSFCGKMSVCNNLHQYGIRYSLTRLHTVAPESESFRQDLEWFSAVCRVVKGLKNLRVGSIGARPAAFNTVRYSEKILERHGISVETLDLSEVLGRIHRLRDDAPAVKEQLDRIKAYTPVEGIPNESLLKMAKLGAVIREWMQANNLTISAIQCWTALEEYFGVVPCTVMSMMSNELMSSACEVDVLGAVAMHMLALASGTPSALLDWNNNYRDDPNKAVSFHCSNLPKHFFQDMRMDYQAIIAGTVGKENTFGTVVGRIRPAPLTFARLSTDDYSGTIRGYVGEGRFTDDPLQTFGGAGVMEIPDLQGLLRFICENGFEHHFAANLAHVASSVHEATTKYLGWQMYWHRPVL